MRQDWAVRLVIAGGVVISASGCGAGFIPAQETLSVSGPPSLKPSPPDTSYKFSPGQAGVFERRYVDALNDANMTPSAENTDAAGVTIRARAMAQAGVELTDSYCAAYFRNGGENQKWLTLSSSLVQGGVALATGVLALVSPANATTAGVVALVGTTATTGVDIYSKTFLFGAENIDSVRDMTFKALVAHQAETLKEDNTPWSFGRAVNVVNGHQLICTPAHIRLLVQQSIRGAPATVTPDAATAGGNTPQAVSTAVANAIPGAAAELQNAGVPPAASTEIAKKAGASAESKVNAGGTVAEAGKAAEQTALNAGSAVPGGVSPAAVKKGAAATRLAFEAALKDAASRKAVPTGNVSVRMGP